MNAKYSDATYGARFVDRLVRTPETVRFLVLTGLASIQFTGPPMLLVGLLSVTPGNVDTAGAVLLPRFALVALILLAILTVFLSVILGAIIRIVISSLGSYFGIASYLMTAICLAGGTLIFRHVTTIVGNVQTGHGPYLLMFLVIWIATIGYLAKIPWDEARDRMVSFLRPRNR